MSIKVLVTLQDNSNLGDDLLFLSGIRLLGIYFSKIHQVEFFIESDRLSKISYDAHQSCSEIPYVKSWTVSERYESEKYFSRIVHLGGTVFSSKYKFRTKIRLFFEDLFRRPRNQAIDLYMSLGVDKGLIRKRYAREALSSVGYLSVRDHASFVAVTDVADRFDSFVIPDSVFSFPMKAILGDIVLDESPSTVKVLRHWPYSTVNRSSCFYTSGSDRSNYVDFCSHDGFAESATHQYKGDFASLRSILKILFSSEYIFSERYHGVVVGLALGRPVIARAIDDKIVSLARELKAVDMGSDGFLFLPKSSPPDTMVSKMYLSMFEICEL